MKILILGAGGIGGYFGAHLIHAGADITYMVRPQRKALLDTHGLRVETPKDAFVVQPRTTTAEDIQPDYDLIILAPKSYDLDDALDSLKRALGKGTDRAVRLVGGRFRMRGWHLVCLFFSSFVAYKQSFDMMSAWPHTTA